MKMNREIKAIKEILADIESDDVELIDNNILKTVNTYFIPYLLTDTTSERSK